jgi:hypothetical protein
MQSYSDVRAVRATLTYGAYQMARSNGRGPSLMARLASQMPERSGTGARSQSNDNDPHLSRQRSKQEGDTVTDKPTPEPIPDPTPEPVPDPVPDPVAGSEDAEAVEEDDDGSEEPTPTPTEPA